MRWLQLTILSVLAAGACAPARQPDMVRLYTPELAEPTSPIRTLLAHYTQLKFSGEQRARLEQIDSALSARNRAVLDSARASDPTLFDHAMLPEGDSAAARRADERSMERRAGRMKPYVEQLRRHQDEAIEQAMQVLRPAQREVAKRILEDSVRRSNGVP